MEIRDQAVQHLELIAGINVDVGPASTLFHGAVLSRPALKGSTGGGPNANDSSARFLGLVDDLRRLRRDHTIFRVHFMLGGVLLLYRAKGPETHMKCNITYLYTH